MGLRRGGAEARKLLTSSKVSVMPSPFHPTDLTISENKPDHRLPDELWTPILQHACDFAPNTFEEVALELIKNPNLNSSHLFRADISYDSKGGELVNVESKIDEASFVIQYGVLLGFEIQRTIIRHLIPRNPQIDKSIAQTCLLLRSISVELQQNLVVYIPHANHLEELPWYHPAVQSIAYLYTWQRTPSVVHHSEIPLVPRGILSLHYRLFPSQSLPLPERLTRTSYHLLSTLHKHGQGQLAGYEKRVHHDQLISQQRVQDTYTELKRKHANRLCDNWVEQTEPSKHVFEDLGIAAFLIELWKDMYGGTVDEKNGHHNNGTSRKQAFSGFVDIGCGNGVLTDVLLREGYKGWGFDARRRKTWATFEPRIQKQLKQLVLMPQPLFEDYISPSKVKSSIMSTIFSLSQRHTLEKIDRHNGIFPKGTFIISNHADELTPWTPLLASLSSSPFLAIPCCSHNLSGSRFRAPSTFNSHTADAHAPSYFAGNVSKSKFVAITVASIDPDDQPKEGNLNSLSVKARAKQPSAYSSLCDWVSHLAGEVGYVVEKEMLRIPSTRNLGIVCRIMCDDIDNEILDVKRDRVTKIVKREKADGEAWASRVGGLLDGKAVAH